jgi:O-antigen/teichoic acid export membrane protein
MDNQLVNAPAPPRRVLRNVLFAIFTKSQSAVFSYLSTLLLLRAMDVPEFGVYSVLFTGVMLNLTLLGQVGTPSLLVRFIPHYYARRQFAHIAEFARRVQIVQVAIAAVLALIVFAAAPQIAIWMHAPGDEAVLRIFALGVVVFMVQENYRVLLNGLFNQRAIFLVNVAYNAVRLAALFYVTTQAYSLGRVVMVEVAVLVAALIFYAVAYRRTLRQLQATNVESPEPLPWPRFRRYAGLCYLNEIGVTLTGVATDLLIVSIILGGSASGLYGLANKIITLARGMMPSRVLSSVIEPLFFSEYGGPNATSTRFGFVLLTKILLWVSIPAMVWLASMSESVIVYFFDPQYAGAAVVVSLLAFALVVESLKLPYGLALQHAERIDLLIYCKISGVVKLALGLWLVPIYGMVAMASVTAGATVLEVALMYYYTVTRLHLQNDVAGLLRLLLNGLIAGAVLWLLHPFLASRIGVLASIVIYSGVYLAVSAVNRPFRSEERDFIRNKAPLPEWLL